MPKRVCWALILGMGFNAFAAEYNEVVVPLYEVSATKTSGYRYYSSTGRSALLPSLYHKPTKPAQATMKALAELALKAAGAHRERAIPRVDDLRVVPTLEQLQNPVFVKPLR